MAFLTESRAFHRRARPSLAVRPEKTRWRRSVSAPVFLTLFLLAVAIPSTAQAPALSEYQVKAAFLYNFAKFVEWPSERFQSETAAIKICILGQDDFGQELDFITRDRLVEGHRIEIEHLFTLSRIKNCHILFVSSSERAHIREILSSVQGKSILTVGDEPGFARSGGVINFILEDARIRFEINLDAANQAHLKISSKLLALAKLVAGAPPGGN
jgi:YfiR/HmsC-like